MVTTGAITNRIDRLEARGLVERAPVPGDRRKVIVRLTPSGRALVDEVVDGHLATERTILEPLSSRQQADLAKLLRSLLLALDDRPPG